VVVSQLGLWIGLFAACLLVSRRRGTGSVLRDFDFRFRWVDLGYGLAGAVAGRLVSAAFACIGAPLIEELFFRGLLQTRLVGRFGVVPGIAVASLLFGAAHMINWQGIDTFTYAWAIAGGGLVLGVIRHVTGRLGPAIVAHAIFNAIALLAIAFLDVG
jgi:membrane protease YdiL (CAAX protease family)